MQAGTLCRLYFWIFTQTRAHARACAFTYKSTSRRTFTHTPTQACTHTHHVISYSALGRTCPSLYLSYLVYVHASLVRSASPFTTHREHTGQPLRLGPEDLDLGPRRARPRRRLHSCIFSSGTANYCFCMTLNNSTELPLPCHACALQKLCTRHDSRVAFHPHVFAFIHPTTLFTMRDRARLRKNDTLKGRQVSLSPCPVHMPPHTVATEEETGTDKCSEAATDCVRA